VFREALSCYKKYYLAKIPQWTGLKDEFKKNLLFKGLRAIMQNSFLRRHMSGMAPMPAEVKQVMSSGGSIVAENTVSCF
jgi:hypothetical protein